MKLHIVLFALVILGLLATARCHRDRDWIHHQYTVLEVSTTDVLTPNALFYGTAPLQNGMSGRTSLIGVFLPGPDFVFTDVWANLLWDEAESRVVGFDVGLCTWTPAVNNTGPLYNLCNTVHYFNDGADQVMLLGAVFIDLENGAQPMAVVGGAGAFRGASGTCTIQGFAENFNFLYVCDFFTPKYN